MLIVARAGCQVNGLLINREEASALIYTSGKVYGILVDLTIFDGLFFDRLLRRIDD